VDSLFSTHPGVEERVQRLRNMVHQARHDISPWG
jgi:Zn-dependent protease with chaperone function